MGKLSGQSVFGILAGVALTALATGLLRAWWVWWWPAVSLSPGGRLCVRFLVLLMVGLLGIVWHWHRWSARYMAVAVAGVLIGLAIGTVVAEDGDSPPASSREYATAILLLDAAKPVIASDEFTGGLMGTTIAVVDEAGIDNEAVQLRRAICEGFDSSFLHHIITIGGPDAALTSLALHKAIRWLPRHTGSKLEILIVTPSPIPDSARQALKEKGLGFRQIEHEFPTSLPERPFDSVGR